MLGLFTTGPLSTLALRENPRAPWKHSCRSEYLWGLIYWFTEPDYHIVGIRFLVCHIINPWFNLETPWSISICQWCPKEKQFCNCQKHDGMVRRTWNQLCKLWYVSHTSICNVTVWKLELFFCQYRKRNYVQCLMKKLLHYVQIISDMPHRISLVLFSLNLWLKNHQCCVWFDI